MGARGRTAAAVHRQFACGRRRAGVGAPRGRRTTTCPGTRDVGVHAGSLSLRRHPAGVTLMRSDTTLTRDDNASHTSVRLRGEPRLHGRMRFQRHVDSTHAAVASPAAGHRGDLAPR